MVEEWRPAVGHFGYEVSNLGNVRSYRRHGRGSAALSDEPHPIKLLTDPQGYLRFTVSVDGKQKRRGVHQLVAETFLADTWFDGAIVCHNDGNPANNRASNLRWATWAENTADRAVHGTLGLRRSAEEIAEIRRLYEMGFYQREIARVFKTTQAYVHEVVTSKKRKDVLQ